MQFCSPLNPSSSLSSPLSFLLPAAALEPEIPGQVRSRRTSRVSRWTCAAFCIAWAGGALAAQSTTRASVSTSGAQGNGASFDGALSADGRFVVFASGATNLVPGETNSCADVFLRDVQTGTTERVSLSSSGVQSDGHSRFCSLSADGRFVAYSSTATNLIAGDTNGKRDVFVRDRLLGTTECVTLDSAGTQANADTYWSEISADGRFVVLLSFASNLVPGDSNGVADVFVRDRLLGTTERVSVGPNGIEGDQECDVNSPPRISADGRFVAFASWATDLVPNDTNGWCDIFVRDRLLGTTERVSVDATSQQGDGESLFPTLSPDGRFVGFTSRSANLVPNDTNGVFDAFLHDRLLGTTERLSVDSNSVEGDADTWCGSISADGRCVVLDGTATNLVPNDTNGAWDGFVRDRLLGTTERVSVSTAGVQGDAPGGAEAISSDGRVVLISSQATNLVAGDTNGVGDVFLRDRGAPQIASFCTPGQAGVVACPCGNPPAGAERGCDNSSGSGGASLAAGGNASLAADTLQFTSSGENASAASLVLQATSAAVPGVVFGQGVRCVGGTLKRLYAGAASGGSFSAPGAGQLAVSARSAALGDAIGAGEHRYYAAYYRDPLVLGGCPATSTFNATDALDVPWSP